MKKIILLLVSVLLFAPHVFADMGAPMIEPYEVTTYNSNGTKLYSREPDEEYNSIYTETNLLVSPGEKFTIEDADLDSEKYMCFEYLDEGGKYANVISDDEYDDNISDTYKEGCILMSDVTAVKSTFKHNKSEWTKATSVYAIVDLEIRIGTGYSYKSAGATIPAGTTFKAQPNERWDNPWYYVEYNGTKGYVCGYKGAIGTNPKDDKTLKTFRIADITDPKTGNVIETIPANKNISVKLYSLDPWFHSYFIEYDGKKGYVDEENITLKEDKMQFKVTHDTKLYKSLDGDEVKDYPVVKTLKKGVSFTSKYYDAGNGYIIVYYEDGDTKGWIYSGVDFKVDKKGNVTLYEVGIPFDWGSEEDPISDDGDDVEIPDQTEVPPIDDDKINGVEPKEEKVPSKTDNTKTILTYVIIGVAVCLCAIIVIILVNKKGKKKNDK